MANVELSSLASVLQSAGCLMDSEVINLASVKAFATTDYAPALRTVAAGVTADVSSIQGGGAITTDVVQISVCANAGDAVTLPAAAAGKRVTIINNGAQSADVFPASGDNLGAGANTAAALAAGVNRTYQAYDATNWFAES